LTVELGNFDEARRVLREAVSEAAEIGDDRLYAQAQVRLGIVEALDGNLAIAEKLLSEGLSLCRDAGDSDGVALALIYLADACITKADFDQAETLARKSIAESRRLSDKVGELRSLNVLGTILCERGKVGDGIDVFSAVLESWQQLGFTRRAWNPIMNLAYANYLVGDLDSAAKYADHAVTEIRRNGSFRTLPYALATAGSVAAARRDLAGASRAFHEALVLTSNIRDQYVLAEIQESIGVELVALGNHRDATQMLASAAQRFSSIGASRLKSKERPFEDALAKAKRMLGEAEFSANWHAGSSLPLGESVDFSLRMADSLAGYVSKLGDA
jgi:tetratricopeptide (TPR) repeat protein